MSIIYTKFSNERAPQFNIKTEIHEDKVGKRYVCKTSTNDLAKQHLINMNIWHRTMREFYEKHGIDVCNCKEVDNQYIFEYVDGKNLGTLLDELIEKNRNEQVISIIKRYISFAREISKTREFRQCNDFINVFGEYDFFDNKLLSVHEYANIDLIFENIIENNKWTIIDYEWVFDFEVPTNFVIYRALFYLQYNTPYQHLLKEMNLYKLAGITNEELIVYEQMERCFQTYVIGKIVPVKRYYQKGINIKELVGSKIWTCKEISFQIYSDMGQGISEEESYRYDIELDNSGEFKLSIPIKENIMTVRIDPGDKTVIMHVSKCNYEIDNTNGFYVAPDTIYFPENDPWFFIKVFSNVRGDIVLEGNIGKVDQSTKLILDNYIKSKNEYERSLNSYRGQNELLSKKNSLIKAENDVLTRKLIDANNEIESKQNEIKDILNSNSWKITKGFRKLSRLVKHESIIEIQDYNRPEIAVHLHLFYTDLLDEFTNYFSNIPYEFDLFISCVKGADIKEIQEKASKILNVNHIFVRKCENRGRDIAPFYVDFGPELSKYNYLLHVHSKKSKHIEEGGTEWRKYSLDSLVGSKEIVNNIFCKFRNEDNIGLIYPECHNDIPMIGYTWMANKYQGKILLESMSIPFNEGIFNYPAGSFFWVRTDAIKPLFDRKFVVEDFPEEAGQIDGTLAHVLERAIVFIVKSRGYHSYIIDNAENEMRYDVSTKPYKEYLNTSLDEVKKNLLSYDSISFAVFDTLVELLLTNMKDIAYLVRDRFGFNDDFVNYRVEAERRARLQKGATTSIDDIYNVICDISPFEKEVCEQIKQVEIEILLSNVIPRNDMKQLFRFLKEQGKEIAIITDTCYHRSTVESILIKCGFIGFDRIWISNEEGTSKEDEQIWNIVFDKYDKNKHIHLGSDVFSDWYTLERRAAHSMWIMSPMEAFKLSKDFNADKDYENILIDESIELAKKIKKDKYNSAFGLGEKLL